MEENLSNRTYNIQKLPSYERPRERLAIHGSQVLSAVELLQLLLCAGDKTHSVAELSYSLLEKFGSLQAISEATLGELCHIGGLGQAKASQIKACFEIARRIYSVNKVWEKIPVLTQFSTSEVVALIRSKISSYKKEHFLIASFDTRNRLIACDLLTVGILNASLVHPRETFIPALKHHASFVVVGHNHPSGDLEPSDEDIMVTSRLEAAGKILGVELFDHVIVGQNGFLSFRDQNLL